MAKTQENTLVRKHFVFTENKIVLDSICIMLTEKLH